jgi:hypothetical protein
MLHKLRITLAAIIVGLATVSAADSASAQATWRSLGSRSGGEVLGDFSLNSAWLSMILPYIEQDAMFRGP